MNKHILSAILGLSAVFGGYCQGYNVVVTTTDGEQHKYETSGVEKVLFEEAPLYVDAEYVYQSDYHTQDGQGIYEILFATAPEDQYGMPASVGDIGIALRINAPASDDRFNAVLPAGLYNMGNGTQEFTWNVEKSGLYMRLDEGPDGIATYMMTSGIVDVREVPEGYDIRMEMRLFSGESVNLQYVGPLSFTLSALESDEFDSDIKDIKFTNCQGRFYSNWSYPFCTDMLLQLYNGVFENGVQTEGYWLNVPIFMPRVEDPMNPVQRIADGVYTVESRDLINYTELPFTFRYGRMVDLWGDLAPDGAYLTYTGGEGSATKRALFIGGTITVSENGTRISFDLTTENPDVSFTGTFSGEPLIVNFCDNDTKEPDMSGTLTEDYKLKFDKGQTAFSFPMGDLIVPGIMQYTVQITDPDFSTGEYIQLDLLNDGTILPDGTYEINNGLKEFTGIEGVIDPAGQPIFSWMGILDELDEEGNQTTVAPIRGGSVTFTTLSVEDIKLDGAEQIATKRIDFNLLDEKGNNITGTYEGEFIDFSVYVPEATSSKAPAKLPARK